MKPGTETARINGRRGASTASQRAKSARKKASAPFFFGKQAALFALACIGIIVLDLCLYMGIAIYDNELNFGNGSPKSITREIGDTLALQEDGGYDVPEATKAWMREEQCWAMLLPDAGEPVWNEGAPEEVLRPYSMTDVAVFSRMGYLDDYPCFVWRHDDGLLVTGFPKDSYVRNVIDYLPQQSMKNWPLYILLIFFTDAAVLFFVYAASKRRVVASTAPMIEALDALAHEKPAHVQLKGSLRDVGEIINATSAIMWRKDQARKRWVTGVSHDIRTPLAISLGHAERIADDETLGDDVRAQARVIVRQSERIRDLVSDLNIASKLEYDMQPVDRAPVRPARLLRSIAADYANTYDDGRFVIEADIDPACEPLAIELDERLIERALRNLANNAIRHNDAGCAIVVSARMIDGSVALGVADDGAGMSAEAVARLNEEADEIACEALPDREMPSNGPTPPPDWAAWCPEKAAALKRARGDACETKEESPALAPCGENASLAPKDLVGLNEHGLGLSLVARIAVAHGGRVVFSGEKRGFQAVMLLPIERSGGENGRTNA